MLRSRHVSVEPVVNISTPTTVTNNVEETAVVHTNSNDSTMGPAYFFDTSTNAATCNERIAAQIRKDPALFKFEMAMYLPESTKAGVNNHNNGKLQATSVRDDERSAAMETPPPRAIEGGNDDVDSNFDEADDESTSATVFFRIDIAFSRSTYAKSRLLKK